MCGLLAVLLADPDARSCQLLYDGLTMLQHRGQDAAGMVTSDSSAGTLHMRKSTGLVKEVFASAHMASLLGNMGIAHCRYPTAGTSSSAEAQPFYTNMPFGLCLAHNGNLVNDAELITKLRVTSLRHSNTQSDSEALLNLFADELQQRCPRGTTIPSDTAIFETVEACIQQSVGGYSVVVLINGVGIVGFRDPWGIRPLCYGSRTAIHLDAPELAAVAEDDGTTAAKPPSPPAVKDYVIASESVALDVLDFDLVGDIAPGECIFLKAGGVAPVMKQCTPASHGTVNLTPCLFEYVYFARPDSIQNGISVYQARRNMGVTLADRIKEVWGADHGIEVVVPIPDTSRTSALSLANALGVPYQEGLIKNRYIARTFIMPGQPIRRSAVRLKLNTIKSEIEGKKVLLVDDSIVRGTTASKIVELVRKAGALSVDFVSAAPKVIHPNVYGIDMPSRDELIGHGRTDEEVAAKIGADRVLFQDLAALEKAVRSLNPSINGFESSVFNGVYITPGVDDAYLAALAQRRSDANKRTATAAQSLVSSRTSNQAILALSNSTPPRGGGGSRASNGDAEGMFNLRTMKEA